MKFDVPRDLVKDHDWLTCIVFSIIIIPYLYTFSV